MSSMQQINVRLMREMPNCENRLGSVVSGLSRTFSAMTKKNIETDHQIDYCTSIPRTNIAKLLTPLPCLTSCCLGGGGI